MNTYWDILYGYCNIIKWLNHCTITLNIPKSNHPSSGLEQVALITP